MMGDEDLQFEILRFRQRNEILISENEILKNELELCRGLYDQSSKANANKEIGGLDPARAIGIHQQLHHKNALIEKFILKLSMISRSFQHEKNILIEMRGFVQQFQEQIMAQVTESMHELSSKVQISESKSKQKYYLLLKDYKVVFDELNVQKSEMDRMMSEYRQFKGTLAKQREDFDSELSSTSKALIEMEESRASDLNIFNFKLAELDAELGAVKKQKALVEEDLLLKSNKCARIEIENRDLLRLCREASDTTTSSEEVKSLIYENEYVIKMKTDENLLLINRVKDLQSSLSSAQSQYERLLGTNESLQSDMQSILRREVLLRNELGSKGVDSMEVQFKLKSIQDKLGRIEIDHEDALRRKTDEKKELEKSVDSLKTVVLQANKRVAELEKQNKDFLFQREQMENSFRSKTTENETQLAKVTHEVELLKGNEKAHLKAIEDLRDDRDQFEKQLAKVITSNKQLTTKSEAWSKEREKLTEEVVSLQKQLKDIEHQKRMQVVQDGDVNNLKQEISLRNEEIKALKDTIRRECEERTNLLISISEMKDRIKSQDNNNLSSQVYSIHVPKSYNVNKSQLVSGEYVDTDLQPFLKSLTCSNSSGSGLAASSHIKQHGPGSAGGHSNGFVSAELGGGSLDDNDDPVTSAAWLNRLQKNMNKSKDKDKKRSTKI